MKRSSTYVGLVLLGSYFGEKVRHTVRCWCQLAQLWLACNLLLNESSPRAVSSDKEQHSGFPQHGGLSMGTEKQGGASHSFHHFYSFLRHLCRCRCQAAAHSIFVRIQLPYSYISLLCSSSLVLTSCQPKCFLPSASFSRDDIAWVANGICLNVLCGEHLHDVWSQFSSSYM
jgi:hypothetical protein